MLQSPRLQMTATSLGALTVIYGAVRAFSRHFSAWKGGGVWTQTNSSSRQTLTSSASGSATKRVKGAASADIAAIDGPRAIPHPLQTGAPDAAAEAVSHG